jgi:hypothetical protein
VEVDDPLSLAPALGKFLGFAGSQAEQKAKQLSPLLDELEKLQPLGDSPVPLPDDLITALRQLVTPPDWWSLLVFTSVLICDKLRDPHIWLGAHKPPGWSRMITLNYSPTAPTGQASPTPPPAVSVGLAVTDPGTHGIRIDLRDGAPPVTLRGGGLTLELSGSGAAAWQYDFGGTVTPVPPTAAPPAAQLTATATWDPGWQKTTTLFNGSLGQLQAGLTLATGASAYSAAIALGPMGARLTPAAELGGLASALLQLSDIEVAYRPQLVVAQNQPPSFSLGS